MRCPVDGLPDNTTYTESCGLYALLILSPLSSVVLVYGCVAETLFFGRQDAMQRTTLLPLSDFMRAQGLDPARMTLAEVGCGTGRLHTFIKASETRDVQFCLNRGGTRADHTAPLACRSP